MLSRARTGAVTVRGLVIALALASSACNVPIAHFTAIGDPAGGAGNAMSADPVRGETCHWWVLGVTFGLPHVEDAVADALARAGTTGVLRDVDLTSVHPVYGPAGRHCYVVTGTPADAGGAR
jgi:hypothetical protein